MVNYLRAELYKVLHRKNYTYGFLLFLLVGAGFLVFTWAYTNSRGNDVGFAFGAGMLGTLLSMGFYAVVVTGDIVFSEQYKFNTLKNEVSYGIPRVRLYLGKLAVSCLVAVVSCILVISFYLALCWAVLPHDPTLDGEVLRTVVFQALAMLPLWLGAQGLVFCFFTVFKSSTGASFAFIGVLVAVPEILKLLTYFVHPGFAKVRAFLLNTAYETMPLPWDWATVGYGCAVGIGWFLASTLLGVLSLRKREIS